MKAETFFEDCLRAVRKFNSTYERYAELSDTSIGAIKYDEAHGSSGDPMARIDEAMDYEQIVAERKAEMDELLDEATSILYEGECVAKLKGPIYADTICLHYLHDEKWSEIAARYGMDGKQARNYAMSGLACIDRHGLLRKVHQ